MFVNADGSSSCLERISQTSFACTATITDPATGAFTLVDSNSNAVGTLDFVAGTASGTYHDPTATPPDGNFVAQRR